jgi:hypothetical protein
MPVQSLTQFLGTGVQNGGRNEQRKECVRQVGTGPLTYIFPLCKGEKSWELSFLPTSSCLNKSVEKPEAATCKTGMTGSTPGAGWGRPPLQTKTREAGEENQVGSREAKTVLGAAWRLDWTQVLGTLGRQNCYSPPLETGEKPAPCPTYHPGPDWQCCPAPRSLEAGGQAPPLSQALPSNLPPHPQGPYRAPEPNLSPFQSMAPSSS